MCFSAGASFAGGVIISAIGVITIRKVHKPSQILFASIPLFFGFQQFAEGIVWLTLPLQGYEIVRNLAVYIFLITAQLIWPMLIPLSVLFMEVSEKKKKILKVLLLAGATLSVYYGYCLITYNVNPQIQGYHIQYENDFPKPLALPSFIIYLIATIVPLFVSSIKRTHLLGLLMTLSCLLTGIFFTQYLTSVWCFFAALISGVIFWIMSDSRKKFNLDRLNFIMNPFKESRS
jgi:hypothetical protein